MQKWSEYFQNPAFLEMSRMMIMNRDMIPAVVSYIGIPEGASVLDVGCGTGAFSFYLADGTHHVRYTGVDNDDGFVEAAARRAAAREDDNTFSFVLGNALKLPFEDGAFDFVVSHTVLTSIPDWAGAIREMMRVVKPGGTVASVTAMTIYHQTSFAGVWPAERYPWYPRYMQLLNKVQAMYQGLVPLEQYTQGIKPEAVPYAFSALGLQKTRAYPIGKFFSLSNAALPREDRERYLRLEYEADMTRMNFLLQNEEAGKYLTAEEAEEYRQLKDIRLHVLLSDPEENRIWEWLGDANLLVCGTKKG